MRNVDCWRLHDRATRGEALTTDESERLAAWYAAQDEEERALLSAHSSDETDALRLAIRHAAAQVQSAAERVASLAPENEDLRHEIAALPQRLATLQTAMSS